MWHQQIHFNEESEKNYIFICIVKRWQNPRLCFYTMLINNNEHTHSLAHIFTWQKECNQSNRAHYLFKCFSSGILLSDFHISASVSSVFCLLAPVVDFMIMWNISIDVCVCMHNEKTSNRNLSPDYRHENGVYLIFLFVVCVCVSFFLFSHHSASVSISTREIDIFHFGWRCIYQVHIFPFLYDDSGPRFIDWLFNDFPQLNFDCFNCLPIGFYDVCMRLVWMCVCDVGNT